MIVFTQRLSVLSLMMLLFSTCHLGGRVLGFCLPGRRVKLICKTPTRCFSQMDDLMLDVENLVEQLESNGENSTVQSKNKGWKSLDLDGLVLRETKPSPIEEKIIQGRRLFIKRDDLLRLHGSHISGNKARKMKAINEIPADDFPGCLVSYGGPQSNSMLALAALVNYKSREALNGNQTKRFVYYTKKLPRNLRTQPNGNIFRATTLGMEIRELSHQEYGDLFGSDFGGSPEPPIGLDPPVFGDSLWVPQGGAFGMATLGARVLADEILTFWSENGNGGSLSVCLPGGTCSTAVLLHHELKKIQKEPDVRPLDIEIVVIPCVGSAAYASRQMKALSAEIGADVEDLPAILLPAPIDPHKQAEKTSRYFSFGQPHKAILDTFKKMRDDHGVVLDLIYAAPAWTVLLKHWNTTLSPDLSFDPYNPIAGRELLYVHCGGLEGINSQLLRYKHKGLVSNDDIQFPGKKKMKAK